MFRLREAFRTLFDPAATILFVLSSLLLSTFTNAMYEIVRDMMGAYPYKLQVIALSTMVLLVCTVGALYWRTTRKLVNKVVVSADQQSEKRPALVVLVSPGDMEKTSERGAIRHHHGVVRNCWLVASPEAVRTGKVDALERMLRSDAIIPHTISIQDGYRSDMAYNAIEQAYAQAQKVAGALPLLVDITGGTKPMTGGAILACHALGLDVQYMLGKYNENGERDARVGSEAVKVQVV